MNLTGCGAQGKDSISHTSLELLASDKCLSTSFLFKHCWACVSVSHRQGKNLLSLFLGWPDFAPPETKYLTHGGPYLGSLVFVCIDLGPLIRWEPEA